MLLRVAQAVCVRREGWRTAWLRGGTDRSGVFKRSTHFSLSAAGDHQRAAQHKLCDGDAAVEDKVATNAATVWTVSLPAVRAARHTAILQAHAREVQHARQRRAAAHHQRRAHRTEITNPQRLMKLCVLSEHVTHRRTNRCSDAGRHIACVVTNADEIVICIPPPACTLAMFLSQMPTKS